MRNPEVSLAQASEAALRQVVGGSDMNSILTEGRQIMAISVQERLQRHMDNYETGIRISGVTSVMPRHQARFRMPLMT